MGSLKTDTFTNTKIKILTVTASEEKHLKNIYHLGGDTHAVVSTNAIAERVATQPASVTDMFKKLAKKGYGKS